MRIVVDCETHYRVRRVTVPKENGAIAAYCSESTGNRFAKHSLVRTHITRLGDAIHSMTPYRGVGGNIALKDAALLTSHIIQAHRGQTPLLQAISEYETSMRQYAFAAVEDSLKAMKQFDLQNWDARCKRSA